MKVHVGGFLALSILLVPSMGAAAPDMTAYWHRVALVAREICGEVSDAGSSGSASVGLGGQMSLNRILQSLGRVGINAKLHAGEQWWHGPLQSDLPRIHEDTQACMTREFDTLTSRLILHDRKTHLKISKPRPAQAHTVLASVEVAPSPMQVQNNRGIMTNGQSGGQNIIVNSPTPHDPNGIYVGDLLVGSMTGLGEPDSRGIFIVRKLSLYDGQNPNSTFSFRERSVICDGVSSHSYGKMIDARGSALTIWDARCKFLD